jgi:hypothetical protein
MEPSRRLSPATIALLVLGFLLLRAALFAVTTAGEYALFKRYADTIRASSFSALYRDADVEYPPLGVLLGVPVAYLADALPAGAERLTVWRPNDTQGPASARFEVALGLVLFAVDLACLALVYVIARRLYPHESQRARVARLGVYVAATTAGGLILFDRQDLVVGLFALLALAACLRGWSFAVYAILVAGTAYKLVPVLLLPVFVLAFAAMRSAPSATPRRFLLAMVKEALVAGLVLAAYPLLSYLLWGGRSFVFLDFHSARGLQLEASPTWLVFLLDPSTKVGYGHVSFTLVGALADRVAVWSTIATPVVMALCVLVVGRGFWRAAGAAEPPARNALVAHLAAGSLLMWLGFILFTKVGSPQYLLWPAALLPLLRLRGADRWFVVVLLVTMVFTAVIFPGQYKQVGGGDAFDPLPWPGPTPIGFVLLIGKSLSLTVAFVWLTAIVWRNDPRTATGPAT